VGYLGEKIQDYVKNKYPDLKAHYVHQVDRQGGGSCHPSHQEYC
jgi:glucose-1-phosphate thymidylyltransferase